MTSKQRSYLMSLAQKIEPICQIGKTGMSPETTQSIAEAFNTHELIKVNVQKNCLDDLNELAQTTAERTHSEVVRVIGRKIILYKQAKDPKNRKITLA